MLSPLKLDIRIGLAHYSDGALEMNRNGGNSDSPIKNRRMPLWLRLVLMGLLVLAAAAAFYFNNLKIIEYLESR